MTDVLDASRLTVRGRVPSPVTVPAADVRTQARSGVTVRLEGEVRVEETSDFHLLFTDTRTGKPVDDLQPYLGAAGHVVMLRADGSGFGHRHAETEDAKGRPVLAIPGTRFGPRLDLHARFDRPGAYRLWAQFRLGDGTVITAPFVVHAGRATGADTGR
jgi:Cu+-exporting ATPase